MNKTVEGKIDLVLHLEIDMAELAAMDKEERLKILGWISNAVNGVIHVKNHVKELDEIIQPKQLPVARQDTRGSERAKCKKCNNWYASKQHRLCKEGRAPAPVKPTGTIKVRALV